MSDTTSQPSDERTDGNSSGIELTATERHELFANRRRQLVLEVLDGTPTTVQLEELAAEIATREDGGDVATAETTERAAIALHHNHLPKLADLGLIGYDPTVQLITPAPNSAGSLRATPLADD